VKTQVLPYSYLQTNLDIPNIRQLEDLIIEAIYLDIIRGRLDQKEQQFEVEYTVGRDVPHEAIAGILTSLEQWYVVYYSVYNHRVSYYPYPVAPSYRSSTTATLIQTLDSKLVSLAEHNAVKAREDTQHEEALNVVLKEVAERVREKQNASKRAAASAGRKDEDGMDVDEPGGSNKNRKYV